MPTPEQQGCLSRWQLLLWLMQEQTKPSVPPAQGESHAGGGSF